ncbi:LOW QUALITY PROTEIN: lysine-specific demethylase 4C-like [Amphiura filiformis]|uniref:LOW QUALITY PROTEIN: lysine-specific demethylase 4C-like n=1 Tax=Amphiura filiformis TaxID=82378 RepID=UPI003B22499B
MSLSTENHKIMVFRPTLEEMKDFAGYIKYMESKGAHKAGVAKVIPPKEFVPRKDYSTVDLTIPAPIQQEVMGHKGLFTQFNIQKKPLTYHEFKKMALSDKYKTPDHFDFEDLERKYWRNLAYNSPIYGADVSGTIYDKDWNIWNINRLGTVLDVIEEEQGVKIEGVNTAYLYFGMWKTTFAWHTEDMDLYSINYIHFGAPKTWYAIPPIHAKRLERLASGFYPQNFQVCSNFLRHKMTVISPHILKKYSIPVNKITQETGEFMITFPYGYHSGFNHGFNCAESTNFASNRWIDYGKRANCCTCARDTVKINMDPFVRIFQPERYEAWVLGNDFTYLEDVDGPLSEAQLEAKRDRMPHKRETAMLKRKIAQMEQTKPRRHPVHKRYAQDVDTEVTSAKMPKMPKSPKKGGRISTVTFSSITKLWAAQAQHLMRMLWKWKSRSKTTNPYLLNVKQELKKKIKEKSKHKKSKTDHAEKFAKSPVKQESTKSPVKEEPAKSPFISEPTKSLVREEPTKSPVKEEPVKQEPTKSPVKQEPTKSPVKQEPTKSPVKLDRASRKSSPTKEPHGQKPVKLRTKRALEELKKKEELDVKEETKSEEEVQVRTEHAYSSTPSNGKSHADHVPTVSPEPSASESVKRHGKSRKKHHSSKDRHSKKKSKEKSSRHRSSKDGSSKEKLPKDKSPKEKSSKDRSSKEKLLEKKSKKVKKSRHIGGEEKRGRGKAMKDFTTQEYALMKTWARSMFGLWVTQPNSFEMEQAYNASMADQKPGCCVCTLFYNDKVDMMLSQPSPPQTSAWDSSGKIDSQDWSTGDRAFSSSMSRVAGTEEDRRMVVLTPEYCFSASAENPNPTCMNSLLSPEGRSPILTCSQCMIAVHASCYGEAEIPESGEWKCNRCEEGEFLAECCLCNLRGGALKVTSDDNWAHIVCAMAIPEVTFEDVEAREPINIDRISPARLKLKCFFCRTFIKNSPRNGACIQCSVGKCALSFHVTCAHAAGVIMEASDWPFSVYATCLRHPFPNRDLPRDRPLREVRNGEKVIAKYKNNRYYKSVVAGERDQLFYHVLFDDGTFSDNLFAQDIESHDCIHNKDPQKGEAVTVRWTDNELYNGKFVKSYYVKLYDVEFENESVVTVKREDIYAREEPLPKRVKTRFSHASDMQHEDFLENKVVPEKYRHLPNRDGHPDSPTDMEAPSTSGCTSHSANNGESHVGFLFASQVESDSLLTQYRAEPASPYKVKSEPSLLMEGIADAPAMNVDSPGNSPVKARHESPLRYQVGPVRSSPSLSSPLKTEQVSPLKIRLLPEKVSSPTTHNVNGGSGSQQQQQNSPMSASEAAALAALASLSSFSTQRNPLTH